VVSNFRNIWSGQPEYAVGESLLTVRDRWLKELCGKLCNKALSPNANLFLHFERVLYRSAMTLADNTRQACANRLTSGLNTLQTGEEKGRNSGLSLGGEFEQGQRFGANQRNCKDPSGGQSWKASGQGSGGPPTTSLTRLSTSPVFRQARCSQWTVSYERVSG